MGSCCQWKVSVFGILVVLWAFGEAPRDTLGLRHIHHERTFDPPQHASEFPEGAAAVEWLSKDTNLIPQLRLPPEQWSSKLVMGYAGSYNAEILKPLIYGVMANADPEAMVVLFAPIGETLWLSPELLATGRVFLQEHAMPMGFNKETLPYPVSLRFYVARAFLALTKHSGTTFWLDTRDVFVQDDPFAAFNDGVLHFPRESGAYRLEGPYTWNSEWVRNCYGNKTLNAIGGNYVLNSGTIIGPSDLMRRHFVLIIEQIEQHWQCRRAHGSDQAMHNFLVYTGKVIEAGLPYRIDDQIQGLFAFMAYTHPALWEFRRNEFGQEKMLNRGEGKPYVAIHMWPGDNRVDKQIITPFVKAFDKQIHHKTES